MQAQGLKEKIDELIRVYDHLNLEELVDMIWRTEGMKFDDPPFDDVIAILREMQSENQISWDPDEQFVSTIEGHDFRKIRIKSYLTNLTKWRTTIVGDYMLPNHEGIDIGPIYEILKTYIPDEHATTADITQSLLSDSANDMGILSLSLKRDGNLELEWTLNETRCESHWTNSRFHIHSYVFEEPIPEVIHYLQSQGPSRRDQIMMMLPAGGGLLIFSLMRNIIKRIYPHVLIRVTDIDLNLTTGG
ncbi:MAG: hypothetical protein ACTSRU_09495 [Candidatus Hodarchaeales archaeon]